MSQDQRDPKNDKKNNFFNQNKGKGLAFNRKRRKIKWF